MSTMPSQLISPRMHLGVAVGVLVLVRVAVGVSVPVGVVVIVAVLVRVAVGVIVLVGVAQLMVWLTSRPPLYGGLGGSGGGIIWLVEPGPNWNASVREGQAARFTTSVRVLFGGMAART